MTVQQLGASLSAYFLVVACVAFLVWILTAFTAAWVAPDDRPWAFFWCTLLFLGPLGIVAALLAQARPEEEW